MTKAANSKGKRLDLLLEEQGLCSSRQLARTAIMEGVVLVNGNKVTKPGTLIKDGAKIELTRDWKIQKYVSRGGLKLEKALEEFQIPVQGRICLDIGASTGGFTDCLLKSGAAFVYAVDVGYGQIAWSLRCDERVKVIERTNARNLDRHALYANQAEQADLAVIDVSFISLAKVLPAVIACLDKNTAEVIALVKPQFEAGKENVSKGGVVKSRDVHKQVIERVIAESNQLGLFVHGLTFSPLRGPQGNVEFLLRLRCENTEFDPARIDEVVDEAQLLN